MSYHPSQILPDQEMPPYPPSMVSGQSDTSYPPQLPLNQETEPYTFPMLSAQSDASLPSSIPSAQGALSYPLSMLPNQADTSIPSSMPPAQETPSYPWSITPDQSHMSSPPPMPLAQQTLTYPLPMLLGIPDQSTTFQPSSAPPQAAMPSYSQPGQAATSHQPQMQPTPLPLAYPQYPPSVTGPVRVWCIRIPGDGSPILRVAVDMVMNPYGPLTQLPVLKDWWPEIDPIAQLFVRILLF